MSNLLKAFDSYNDFECKSFFTLLYDVIASELNLEIPFIASKKNIESVINLIKPKQNDFELVYKKWSTEDSNNSDHSKDYPFLLLYKNLKTKCTLKVVLDDDTLEIEFLYDCSDLELEKWVIDTNHLVRSKFGLASAPSFKVLTKSGSHFDTEEVRTQRTEIDINHNYNDDFGKIHRKIQNSIKGRESGLILLHGKPGTGKTTYIKSLISTYQDMAFIFIQNEFIKNLLEPDFISFLLKHRNAILIIEDAEKVITARSQMKEESVVSTILQLTDGLFSDYLNLKIICTFNSKLSQIDSALLRKGRMISMYEFKPLSLEKTNKLLLSLGTNESKIGLSVSDIYNFSQDLHKNIEKNKIGF